jgi:hypothetical protein
MADQLQNQDDFDPTMFLDDDAKPKPEEKPPEDKEWLIPGRFKDKTEVLREITEKDQELRQLRAKLKQNPSKEEATTEQLDDVGIAMKELGIEDNEVFLKPKENIAKIVNHAIKKTKEELSRDAGLIGSEIKAEILKDKLSDIFPDFVMDSNSEAKIVNMIGSKYSKEYIRANQVKVFSEAIESLGGKRGSEPSIERGDGGEIPLRGKRLEDEEGKQISEIMSADVGDGDPIDKLMQLSKKSKEAKK